VSEKESLRDLVDPSQVRQLLLPQLDRDHAGDPVAAGVNASPGAAVGAVVFEADEAERRGRAGEQVILVREETTPDDLHGMIQAQGVLTARGGKTSHAAIVAVGMGKPAVCGVGEIEIDEAARVMTIAGRRLAESDFVTIDGTTGNVYLGQAPLLPSQADNPYLLRILDWSDRHRRLRVRTNADTPEDAERARGFGAEGIGLCRTEHMFFAEDRLPHVQAMIMAADDVARQDQLARLRRFQEEDFAGIFRAMAGLPVTIRLLDPPLHEFLPSLVDLSVEAERARAEGREDPELEARLARVQQLHEMNPMLGTRGCRLGIEWPDIYRMQVAAIMSAACAVAEESGKAPRVEIMIPLVAFAEELRLLREESVDVAETVLRERGRPLEYLIGTMIELPRAALTADEIAAHADFFSFGTNDLTQTTLGFSRDDAEGKFLTHYLQRNVIPANPFETLDQEGVGALVRMATTSARAVRPAIKLGICGEHGGDPESVRFCHREGLDYVSCSPYRVQVARIAAGQAAVQGGGTA
jgi:pyruvate,orthophosphate dikinase